MKKKRYLSYNQDLHILGARYLDQCLTKNTKEEKDKKDFFFLHFKMLETAKAKRKQTKKVQYVHSQ